MKAERRTSVLLTVPSMKIGGAERLVSILVRELDRRRVSPMLAVFQDEGALRTTVPDDVPVFDLGKRSPWSLPALVLRMRSLMRRTRPDVAIGFMTYANLILLTASMRSGVPVIVTEHSRPSGAGRHRRRRQRQVAARLLYRRASRVVAVSDGVRRELIDLYRLPPGRVVTIHNPLDPAIIGRARPLSSRDRELRVLSVGRLSPEKGHRFLLEAIAQMPSSPRTTLALVGDGPDREALERQAIELGAADRITFLGHRSDPFAAVDADVFVLPSLREGFGIVLTEAMHIGLPVIAADCQFGPSEIVEPEVSGLLVPPGDPQALREALTRIATEDGLADRLSRAGSQRAEDFTVNRILPTYERLIHEVAAT